jgi:hypothetical protein
MLREGLQHGQAGWESVLESVVEVRIDKFH